MKKGLAAETAKATLPTDFEDFAVCLPVVPNGVFFVLRRAISAPGTCGVEYFVKEGSIVNIGEELARLRGLSSETMHPGVKIVAPFAGKIVYVGGDVGHTSAWDEQEGWPRLGDVRHNVLIAIQPAKGQSLMTPTAIAYADLIGFVRKALDSKRWGNVDWDADAERKVRQELTLLPETKEKITSSDVEASWKEILSQYLAEQQRARQQ